MKVQGRCGTPRCQARSGWRGLHSLEGPGMSVGSWLGTRRDVNAQDLIELLKDSFLPPELR